MDNVLLFLKLGIAAIGTFLTYLFGGWSVSLIGLLIFIGLDFITGVLCGIGRKKVSSETMFAGLAKKALILVILMAGAALDKLLNAPMVCQTAVCYFYIANEGISIIENASILGLPVPPKIKNVLEQLRDKNETEE